MLLVLCATNVIAAIVFKLVCMNFLLKCLKTHAAVKVKSTVIVCSQEQSCMKVPK